MKNLMKTGKTATSCQQNTIYCYWIWTISISI